MEPTTVPFAMMQQRREIRRAVELPCTMLRQRDHKIVGVRSFDLSPEGMLVGALDELREGDEVFVAFSYTSFDLNFRTTGQVTRVLQGRRSKDRMPSVAVRFDALDAVSRVILRGHLRRVPPVLPARARRIDYAGTVSRLLLSQNAA